MSAQKVPTRQETRALKESLATRDIATPSSPYVNRRILSPSLESELRAACEAVLNEDGNSYGAAAALQAQESKLDFQALQRSMKAMEQAQQQSGHRRTGSHPPSNPLPRRDHHSHETTARLPSNAFAYKPDAALRDLFPDQGPYPVQANTSRRREGHASACDKSGRSVSGKYREQQHDHTTGRPAGLKLHLSCFKSFVLPSFQSFAGTTDFGSSVFCKPFCLARRCRVLPRNLRS